MIKKVEVKTYLERGERRYIDLLNKYLKKGGTDDETEIVAIIERYVTFQGHLRMPVLKNQLILRLKTDRDIINSLN